MTEPDPYAAERQAMIAQAGAAGAGAGGSGTGANLITASPPGVFATELHDGDLAYGVRFGSPYEPGTDYPPVPPPPAEEQHAMGLHPQAAADERAMRKRNPEMQGTEEKPGPMSGRVTDDDSGG